MNKTTSPQQNMPGINSKNKNTPPPPHPTPPHKKRIRRGSLDGADWTLRNLSAIVRARASRHGRIEYVRVGRNVVLGRK